MKGASRTDREDNNRTRQDGYVWFHTSKAFTSKESVC